MKRLFLFFVFILAFTSNKIHATHGLPIVGLASVTTATGITVSGGSDAATCGSGPYWMQVEVVCTPTGLTGTPPATLQTILAAGAGGATVYNVHPWYNSLLNLATMVAPNWTDNCVAGEQYRNINIPFAGLCPGQTYYWAAREWVGGSNSPGPWSTVRSFVVPGVLTPLNFNVAATPAVYCSPGSSTLTATGIVGGCGNTTVLWSTGSTATSIVVSPAVTTVYSCTVSAPCMTPVVRTVTVTVVPSVSAAFAPTNTTICSGASQVFTHTGTAGVNHNWSVSPTTGVTVATSTSTNPAITFATAGSYVVTHSVNIGSCSNVVTTNVTVNSIASSFTIPSATQCLSGNSFSFNNTGTATGTHSYSFSPVTGAPAVGSTANYSGSFTAAGTYSVTHTVTSGGCTSATTQTVQVNPMPAGTVTFTNPTCGLANGIVQINNTSLPTPAQTVTFASSLGTLAGQTVTGLGAGSPVITLTNNFGCTFTVSPTLTNIPGPTALPLTPNNIICGTGTGSITIGTPSGGTAPYSYNVNGGAFSLSPPVTGLASGTYTVGVRDNNNCIFTNTAIISITSGPTAITGTASPSSCGAANGSYNVTGITGGTPPYTITVNGATTTSLTSNLATGTHSISVRDNNGCVYNSTFFVPGTSGPTAAVVTTTNATCGASNGSAAVSGVTGGVSPYSFSFDGGTFSTTDNISALGAGLHTVVVRDANSCSYSLTYNISNAGSPTASVTNSINISCFGGSNGSFTVTPVGGTGPLYTYTLSGPSTTQNGTGIFSSLLPGTYNVTVRDQAGCVTTTSVSLVQPTALTLSTSAIAVRCFGTSTGTINLTGGGGTPTYSYNLNNGTYQTSSTFANQFAGIYNMGIRDVNGCTTTQTVEVTQPTALTIQVSTQNANCTAANGIASTTVTGGTGVITYSWTGGGGSAPTTGGLVSGTYTVTATDNNGCSISSPAVIGTTPGGTATITSVSNITCNGFCDGSISAGITGSATAPYTYSWTPGGQTGATASNLCPGTYTCQITDFYGCRSSAVATITQPPILTAIMNSNNVKCYGTSTGTVSAAGSGGVGPYTYLWTTPVVSTLQSVSDVEIGNYVCSITDANNCSITQSISVTQPTSITITSSVTSANCNQANGSASVTISGGISPYSQTWSTGTSTSSILGPVLAGTYNTIITDANACTQTLAVTIPNIAGPTISISSHTNVSCFGGNNGGANISVTGGMGTYIYSWSNGVGTPMATNLTAGLYTVSATDQAGCVASTSVTITEPNALAVSIVPIHPKCFGALNGGGIASAIGGTPSYTYAWTSTGGNTSTSNPLGAGNYAVNVTDGNGCVATATMELINPPAMAASITATNVSCFGLTNATAVATSTNAIGVISYYWTGMPSAVTSQTLTGVGAGTYSVIVTDQNNCTANAEITITQPGALTASISATGSITCNGGNNGFASVVATGGTGGYTYSWTPGNVTTSTANNLTAGVYVATVTDGLMCTATATASVIEPTPLSTTLTTTNVKCNGASDGTANIAYGGGAGTTTFLWSPGLQTGNPVNNLIAGPQSVTITSNGSCQTVLTFTLTEPAPLTAVVTVTNSNCGQANGRACVVVGGGTSPLNPLWSNGVNNLCNNNVVGGAYTFTVTDANNCMAFVSGLVNDIAGPVVTVTGYTNVSCYNGNNGAATSSVFGGVAPYTSLWTSTTYTTQNVSTFIAGLYNIEVTDNAGCVGSASVNITQPTQLVSAISSQTNISCFGLSDGSANVLSNGGTGAHSYAWLPSGQTNALLTNVVAGTYTATVTDANGCTTQSQVNITQPSALVMASSSFSNVSCFGGSNGQIITVVQGGTGGLNYVWSPSGSGSSLNGLPIGPRTVTVTDANNCSITANFNITEPSILASSYASAPATCGLSNGSATLTITGGTPNYTTVWNGGTPNVGGTISTNMSPGTNWLATITDAHGCTLTQTVGIINPPVPAITGFSVNAPSCFGLSNGDITVNYSAGTAPYTTVWSNPISQTLTTTGLSQNVAGITAGSYVVTVSDNYGCTSSMPVNVTQPQMLIANVTPNTTICYGQSTQISASGQNGTPAYSYTWTPNPLTGGGPHTVNPITTSTYVVVIADINGCTTPPKLITVNVTPQIIVTPTVHTICHGEQITLTPNIVSAGNGGPYTYNWAPGGVTTSSLSVKGNAPAGVPITYTYALTVSDGCTIPNGNAIYTVNVNPLPIIDFVATPTAGCAPLTLTLTGMSNQAGDLFTWTDAAGGNQNPMVITLQDSGKHSISLLVTNPTTGCKQDTTKIDYIHVYPQPIASFYANPQAASILDPNITFYNTSQGASSYYWDFGDPAASLAANTSTVVSPNHFYSYVGPYVVNLIATSNKGCKDVASIKVEIVPDFALYIPNAFTPDGNGVNDMFLPMGVGIDEEDYRMDIYDRWGENIFTSNSFRKGWDGTVKGGSKMAAQGVYTYKLMVKDTQGNKHPYVGHVTVIKKED